MRLAAWAVPIARVCGGGRAVGGGVRPRLVYTSGTALLNEPANQSIVYAMRRHLISLTQYSLLFSLPVEFHMETLSQNAHPGRCAASIAQLPDARFFAELEQSALLVDCVQLDQSAADFAVVRAALRAYLQLRVAFTL